MKATDEALCAGVPITVLKPTRATARNKFDSGARYRAARRAWQAKQETKWLEANAETQAAADTVKELENLIREHSRLDVACPCGT